MAKNPSNAEIALIVAALQAALRLARRPNPFEDAARGRDVAESSGGGVEGHARTSARSAHSAEIETCDGGAVKGAGIEPGPPEAKSKRGRPRIGEVREKPWLTSEPPMSERTWYRRQREQREQRK